MGATVGMPDADALRAAAPALPPGACYRVCYSGGLDSSTLLHALWRAALRPLQALHVDHGLQPQSQDWARRCAAVCAALDIPLQVLRVEVAPAHRQGPEAAARAARYEALRKVMHSGDVLVLAHHRDDQAETVLMRLLRGTGIAGLAAMRPHAEFAPGRLWRPLLDTPRTSLRAYAEQQQLQWIDDPHNADLRYTRVWLRREILSLLELRLPSASRNLARAASHAAEQAALLEELADADLGGLQQGDSLRITGLLRLTPARQRNALRNWLQRRGFHPPNTNILQRLQREVLMAPADAAPLLRSGDCELRRYRDALYLMPPLPLPPAEGVGVIWSTDTRIELPAGCGGLQAPRPPPQPLRICFARGGERLRPAGSAHTRSLKNLFQEAGIPPWRRRRTPLLEMEGELVWVPGLPPTAIWRQLCAEQRWQPHYQPSA